MAAITPSFNGSYAGDMIYTITSYEIGDAFRQYVESVEIVYDSIHKRAGTGFIDTKYLENAMDALGASGSISITLVGDLPTWLMSQFTQLAKACLGGGMTLSFDDDFVSYNVYNCRWENAGDFVENDELLCGGTMLLRFYAV